MLSGAGVCRGRRKGGEDCGSRFGVLGLVPHLLAGEAGMGRPAPDRAFQFGVDHVDNECALGVVARYDVLARPDTAPAVVQAVAVIAAIGAAESRPVVAADIGL